MAAVGCIVTFRSVTPGTYNTSTGKVVDSVSDTTVKGFVKGVTAKEVGGLIQSGDRRLTVAASSLTSTPSTADRVIISNVTYQIISVNTVEQANTAISYELVLRS